MNTHIKSCKKGTLETYIEKRRQYHVKPLIIIHMYKYRGVSYILLKRFK